LNTRSWGKEVRGDMRETEESVMEGGQTMQTMHPKVSSTKSVSSFLLAASFSATLKKRRRRRRRRWRRRR